MTFKGFRKEAPLMIEAAAFTAAQHETDATDLARTATGMTSTAGAA